MRWQQERAVKHFMEKTGLSKSQAVRGLITRGYKAWVDEGQDVKEEILLVLPCRDGSFVKVSLLKGGGKNSLVSVDVQKRNT